MKKVITINVGNKGIVLSIKGNNKIFEKLFIDNFNQETLPVVSEFFAKYKKLNAYIILDTVAQNYNYKIFPPLNYFDLQKIVIRRFNSEIPKNDLKQRKFLYKNPIDKRSVYLFISASTDSPLKEWLNFFKTIPNNLLGIYMLPLETVDFAKKIMVSSGMKKVITEKNKWILITFNDRTSDLRQVAIFNNNIAFTRLISLDSAGDNLAEFAKNDIIRTSEYIKRFDAEFTFDKLNIITILDQKNKEALKDLKIEKTIILNYTPHDIAKELNLGNGTIENDEKYSDLLLTLFISKNRSRMRFGNFMLNLIYNIVLLLNLIKKAAAAFILLILISFVSVIFLNILYKSKLVKLNEELSKNKEILQSKSEEKFGMDSEDVDRIIDAGNLKDIFDSKYVDPIPGFESFSVAQGDIALTYALKWTIENFDYQSTSGNNTIKATYDISIINPDGDANKLFNKYDSLSTRLRDTYKNNLTGITTLPNNINFSKKYLTYPIKVEITEGNSVNGKKR